MQVCDGTRTVFIGVACAVVGKEREGRIRARIDADLFDGLRLMSAFDWHSQRDD